MFDDARSQARLINRSISLSNASAKVLETLKPFAASLILDFTTNMVLSPRYKASSGLVFKCFGSKRLNHINKSILGSPMGNPGDPQKKYFDCVVCDDPIAVRQMYHCLSHRDVMVHGGEEGTCLTKCSYLGCDEPLEAYLKELSAVEFGEGVVQQLHQNKDPLARFRGLIKDLQKRVELASMELISRSESIQGSYKVGNFQLTVELKGHRIDVHAKNSEYPDAFFKYAIWDDRDAPPSWGERLKNYFRKDEVRDSPKPIETHPLENDFKKIEDEGPLKADPNGMYGFFCAIQKLPRAISQRISEKTAELEKLLE